MMKIHSIFGLYKWKEEGHRKIKKEKKKLDVTVTNNMMTDEK